MDDEEIPWRTPSRNNGDDRARPGTDSGVNGTSATTATSSANANANASTTPTPAASSGSASTSSQKRKRHAKKRRRADGKAARDDADGSGKLKDDDEAMQGDKDASSTKAEAAEPSQWGCPACTFLNDASRRFCEMCGNGNPVKPVAESAPSEWSCVACTMKNAPTLRACAVCGTINPNPSMPSVLSIARRSLHGGLFLGGAGGVFGEEGEDDEGDDDDGEEDDSDGSSSSSDGGSSDADTDRRLECPCLECGVTIGAGQSSCPECHAPHPFPRRKLKRSDLSSRLQKLTRKVATHDKSSKKKKSKDSQSASTKNAYGVSSEVLQKLLDEPRSSKLVDTLQTLTHTLAMMDASADSEWGDMHGGGVSAFFVHGFGGSGRSDEGKDKALLGVLASVLRDDISRFSAEVRLFSVQSINYILKMDRHLFKKEDVLDVVRIYLGALKNWSARARSDEQKMERISKDEQMIVEECVNGLCGLCGSEGTMLREVLKPIAIEGFLDFLTHLATDTGSTLHSSVIINAFELFQKCCSKMKWDGSGSPSQGDSSASSIAAANSDVLSLNIAKRIVDLLRSLLKHPQPALHVSASKCLLLLFRRGPLRDSKQQVVSTLITSDVIFELVEVLTSKKPEESDDSRQAAASLLMHLLDGRREMLEVFVQGKIYEPLLDGIQRLLLQTGTSASLTSHSLKLVSLLIRRVHRAPTTKPPCKYRSTVAPAMAGKHVQRIRLDSSPDPDVLANLLLDFVRADSIPAVSALLKDGADLNYPTIYDVGGNEIEKPLIVASETASLAMVRFLVKRGVDVHQVGPSGTGLHVAALAGRCDVVSFLLECGASPTDVDRDGISVLKRLENVESAEGELNAVSPVGKLFELHQRAMHNEDSDNSNEDAKDRHGSTSRWILSGDQEFEDDDDEFDEDDQYYLEDDDDDDSELDDDDGMSSDEDIDDSLDAHGKDDLTKTSPEHKKRKRRRESEGSDNREGKATKKNRTNSGDMNVSRTNEASAPSQRRLSSDNMVGDAILATADEIESFRSMVLHSLLSTLRVVDHQNVNRGVLSTLASALEMAPSKLVRTMSDADISLLLETVNHLLQDPIIFTRSSSVPEDEAEKESSRPNGELQPSSKSAPTVPSSSKAMLASYILALRILQAVVRKSTRESSVFYEVERRGICEQIERLHSHAANVSPAKCDGDGLFSGVRTGMFGSGLHLLEFLRSNMVESGMLHLHRLKNMTRRLTGLTETSPIQDRDMVLADLVELFEEENSITSHEFKQSNLLEAIISFLVPIGRTSPIPTRVTLLLDRFARSPAAFNSLISRLQSVVNQEEKLPLRSFFTGKGRELYPLTKQLKIVCTRAQGHSNDDPKLQKMLQLSALTHFQSFEKTIFRCMPVKDGVLASFYFSLIGHSVHKAIDGKWKKLWVCGFDQSRCTHLVKPVDNAAEDVSEIVLHDTQYKLSSAMDVYAEVNVDFGLFGDPIVSTPAKGSVINGADEKKRKRQSKKRSKSAVSEGSGNPAPVEVHNVTSINAGKLRGAWYAGEVVAGVDDGALAAIQPGKAYSVRLLSSGNTLKSIPGEKIRVRNDVPQVGSVVEVDGLLGEVTRVATSGGSSESDIFDVKVSRDRERKGISKDRIRYPPSANSPPSPNSSSGAIEAMSLSRLFPPRESSLTAGTVGDKVWVSPKARAGENVPVGDIYVAGTIHSFPSGSDGIGPGACVFVEVSFGPSSAVIKVDQSRVTNVFNGRSRLGSSRLLSALNMASERGGSSSGSSLHRLLQTSASSELFANRPLSGSGSAIDHLRQLLAGSSSSREAAMSRLLQSSSNDSISTSGAASTDAEVDGMSVSRKSEDASTRINRVWKLLRPGNQKIYSKCIRPPKMSVIVGFERAENEDSVGIDLRNEDELGMPSALFQSRRSPESSFGDAMLTELNGHTGKTVLKPDVASALNDIFSTFDSVEARSRGSVSKNTKKGKKKLKVSASSINEKLVSDGRPLDQRLLWNIDKFSAFMAAVVGTSSIGDPEGTLVDNCVQFSLFALPSTRRILLDRQGFLASVADMCKSARNARQLLAFLVTRGFDASLLTRSNRKKHPVNSQSPIVQAEMKSFPSDQNMLKCLHEMQGSAARMDSTPPWKLKYFVLCDVTIDWSNVIKRDPDSNVEPVQAQSPLFSGELGTIDGVGSDSSMIKSVRLLSYLYEALPSSLKVSDDVWRNARLSNKLETQLEDVLSVCSGVYPDWCDAVVSECKFFFPRNLREKLFQATSFGCTRSLHWFRTQLNVDDGGGSSSNAVSESLANGPGIASDGIYNHEITISPIPKERVKVNRENLLNSAEAVMKMHGKRKAVLDIVFVGEKGYGSGVTAAFYSATAQALQSIQENGKQDSRCWVPGIENEREDDSIRHPNGLFPFPHVSGSPPAKLVERFRMMGRLAGKALMDNRLFPLPLSSQFMKLVLGQSIAVGELERVFLSHGKILKDMKRAVDQVEAGVDAGSIQIDGTPAAQWLEAVGFTFIDPLSQKPLEPNGDLKDVTLGNLKAYVDMVLSLWLHDGICAQVQAFREGISDVLPVEKLNLLFVDELLSLLCGDADIVWDVESLSSTMKLAHGYTKDSLPVQYFVDVLAAMTVPERREFLLYATGCPNLPAGGFAALRPPFEVVRRVVDTDNVDQSLPFARTCTNTLHLPAYSSKDVLDERLRYAIANSAGVIDRD